MPGLGGVDAVVADTRREISEIVREVAGAARSTRSLASFVGLLCDRTLRAMAAEGVTVWQLDHSADGTEYQCIGRLGRITDRSIPPKSAPVHSRMLSEVGFDGGPVVVPPTPGATDRDVPANPLDVPAAIAPIQCDASPGAAEYLIEVFLEPGGGVATQRGYLRFVAQMADLAGEFFRSDQLRGLRRVQELSARVDDLAARMHRAGDQGQLQSLIVDSAAELFELDRVALCKTKPRTTVLAVSHVHTIDHRSDAAGQIRSAAGMQVDADGCRWIEPNDADRTPDEPNFDGTKRPTESAVKLHPVVVAEAASDSARYRLVGFQSEGSPPLDPAVRHQISRFVHHAQWALQSLNHHSFFGLRPSADGKFFSESPRTRFVAVAGLALVGLAICLCPVPMIVSAPATLRPATAQRVCAHRDAVVQEIHVNHGDHVSQGQILLRLVDPSLQESITSLIGRRSVLLQQQSSLTSEMVGSSTGRSGMMQQTLGQQSLVAEEIRSVQEQLAVLERVNQTLTIRADRDGIVDGWQIETELRARPVARGDELLRIVAADSRWWVESQVPQNRIAHVQRMLTLNPDSASPARVLLDAMPEQSLAASLDKIGPATFSNLEQSPANVVRFRLGEAENRFIQTSSGVESFFGAPARVTIPCGSSPLVYVLFQDAINSVRSFAGLYLPIQTDSPEIVQ